MIRRHFIFLSVSVAVFLAALRVFAVDQMKSSEHFITSSDASISSATSSPFTLYIGDNLSGVTNPVKSVYFAVSGVYTGSGSLEMKINDDNATAKAFTLPNVGATPTPFEILYKDETGKISPVSAGSYNYTLNLNPSGVTIYGLGVKMNVTHRFAPPSCPDGQPSNEKIKSSEHFITSSDASISSATSSPFTLYIGDNLSGVTNPVKSVYFAVSGVYTGSGSLEMKINDDNATAKAFTLPNVGATPTPFEILYKDETGKISPVSAGSYNYTLNLNPSGVTIYGLGVKMNVTHRYKPPACGGFPATGELTSMVFDTGTEGAAYNSIMWKGNLPSNTKVQLQLATSNCSNGASDYPTCSVGTWSFMGVSGSGETCSSSDYYDPLADTPADIKCYNEHNNKRYFRYRVQICSSSDCATAGSYTPEVQDVVVSWSP